MRGIPKVVVTVAHDGVYVQPLASGLVASVDIAIDAQAAQGMLHAPVYARPAYRLQPATSWTGMLVWYPRCAGWYDGYGYSCR
jgi:hypothetical protein